MKWSSCKSVTLQKGLLSDAILSRGQSFDRRANHRRAREPLQRGRGNVLELGRDGSAARGQLGQTPLVVVGRPDLPVSHRARWALRVWVENHDPVSHSA